MNKQKQAFTLVELIVVITILAILGTIAFISLQGFSQNARDSTRISDMKSITKGLELELTKIGKLPVPEDKIDIIASGTVISYQGYAGKKTLNKIGIALNGKDPLDETYYTYVVNKNLTQYQILGYLESEEIAFNSKIIKTTNALDLTERFPKVSGNELGILLLTGSLLPIQTTGIPVDIVNTNTGYTLYFNNKDISTGTGSELKKIESIIKYGKASSCKDLLNKREDLKNKDGTYTINPTGYLNINVYCDMTTDGGGWTMLAYGEGEGTSVYNYDDIVSWTAKNSNNCSTDTECLSKSGIEIKNWDSLMVYTRGYKVKGTKCNDKNLSIKGYTELPHIEKVSSSNWENITKGAHGKCDDLYEVSQGLEVSNLSTNNPWPIRMGIRLTSNEGENETSLLLFGPTFIPQGFGNKRGASIGKLNNHYGWDMAHQLNLWDGASTQKQTWFIR